jgi:hypothetical protein
MSQCDHYSYNILIKNILSTLFLLILTLRIFNNPLLDLFYLTMPIETEADKG